MDTSSSETDQSEVTRGRGGMQIVQSGGNEGRKKSNYSNSNDESFSASFPMGTEAYHAMSWASKWRDHEDRREIMSSSSSNNHELANMDWGAVVPENYSWVSHQASNMSDGLLSVHSMTDNQVYQSSPFSILFSPKRNRAVLFSILFYPERQNMFFLFGNEN